VSCGAVRWCGKTAGLGTSLDGLAALVRKVLPELDERQAAEAGVMIFVLAGSLWTHSHPAPAVRRPPPAA
jgi:hypothetical protein